jgi:hypothetical protein
VAISDELIWDGVFGGSGMTAAILADNHEDTHCAFAFWAIDLRAQVLKDVGG